MITIHLFNQTLDFLIYTQEIILTLGKNRFAVLLFQNPQTLVKSITTKGNVYLIDVKFNDSFSDILTLSKQIRQSDSLGKIIYFVPNESFALALLDAHVEPFSYFCKNTHISDKLFEHYLVEIIEAAIAAIEQSHVKDYIHFQDSLIKKRVERSKIMYVENFSRERKIKVVTTEESFFVNTYLGSVREQFDRDTFFVDAQSLIINLTLLHEIQFDTSHVKFNNNSLLSLSPYLLKKVNKAVASGAY